MLRLQALHLFLTQKHLLLRGQLRTRQLCNDLLEFQRFLCRTLSLSVSIRRSANFLRYCLHFQPYSVHFAMQIAQASRQIRGDLSLEFHCTYLILHRNQPLLLLRALAHILFIRIQRFCVTVLDFPAINEQFLEISLGGYPRCLLSPSVLLCSLQAYPQLLNLLQTLNRSLIQSVVRSTAHVNFLIFEDCILRQAHQQECRLGARALMNSVCRPPDISQRPPLSDYFPHEQLIHILLRFVRHSSLET